MKSDCPTQAPICAKRKRASRSAEDVCIEYAIAVECVREQTRIMRDHPCEVQERPEPADWSSNYPGSPGTTSCITDHWEIEVYQGGDDRPMERPKLPFDEMCDGCKVRIKAIEDRKEYRRRLGAAKRAVESVGKRLKAVQ